MSIKDAYDITPVSAFWGKPSKSKKKRKKKLENFKMPGIPGYNAKKRYESYINSDCWKAFRIKVFESRGRQCESCGSFEGRREIHHLTYARLGSEELEDVLVLCHDCHMKRHQ